MIKIFTDMKHIGTGAQLQWIYCPHCNEEHYFNRGGSPYNCFGCGREMIDYSGILSNIHMRKIYHFEGEKNLILDVGEAYNFS